MLANAPQFIYFIRLFRPITISSQCQAKGNCVTDTRVRAATAVKSRRWPHCCTSACPARTSD
jgi:hypothetical protein